MPIEKDTMAKLASFKNFGVKTLTGGGEGKKEKERGDEKKEDATFTHVGSYGWQETLDDYDDEGWLDGGGLNFKKDSKVGFLQREMEADDSLAFYDPLADKRPKKKHDSKQDPFAGSSAREERDSRDGGGRDRGERSRPDSYVGSSGGGRGGGGYRDERERDDRGRGRDSRDDRRDDRRRDDRRDDRRR